MKTVERRLAALELDVNVGRPIDPVDAAAQEARERERREAHERLLAELSATTDVPAFMALTSPGATLDGQPIPPEHVEHLWFEIDMLIHQYAAGYMRRQRFALHPAVVEALLRHGTGAWLLDGCCGACRLPLPYRLHRPGEGYGMAGGPFVFLSCPDCGSENLVSMTGRQSVSLEVIR
jgi:hypothetical protein